MSTITLTDTQDEATMYDLTSSLSSMGRKVFEALGLPMPDTGTFDASASDSDSRSTAAFLEARERTLRAIQETESSIDLPSFDSIESFREWQASL